MTSIPANLSRVPNMLASQALLAGLTRTQTRLIETQLQLATGRAINRPSDNAVGASAVNVLDAILERREQRLRNLAHAGSILGNLDQALGDASELIQEARSIGLSQIGVGSDAETRANQAKVIDAMLNELFSVGNREFQGVHLFGGERTARAPFEGLFEGIRYGGSGDGMITDLGAVSPFEITMSGVEAFGSMTTRVEGDSDLDPHMVTDTRLVDLIGAQGQGIRLGTINVDVNGSDYELDLSSADSVGDVIQMLEEFFAANEPGAIDAGGITIDAATGNRFNLDVAAGFTITFSDLGGSQTVAADLGLSQSPFEDGFSEIGADVGPTLTDLTLISSLPGVTSPLGTIRIENAGQVRDLDLASVETIRDLKNIVASLNLGVRVEIASTRDRLNFVNELSGAALSIGEVGGGTTATELGVRSLARSTRLEDFNDGRGVQVVTGRVDPITGNPDPALNTDFRVTLKDGRTFDVGLSTEETVEDVLDAINAAAVGAGIVVPGEFNADLATDGNGIELTDLTIGTTTSVVALNGSFAAEDLGILGSSDSASLTGEDRAKVAVDSVFSHLIALRDALEANDERGIQFATQRMEADVNRLAGARASSGVRAQRVDRLTMREEELKLQDIGLRSMIQDLDYSEAATRFANLQTQLQAGLATTSQAMSLSLIDFLR